MNPLVRKLRRLPDIHKEHVSALKAVKHGFGVQVSRITHFLLQLVGSRVCQLQSAFYVLSHR
jgi:hypothetical protein